MNLRAIHKLAVCGFLAVATLATPQLIAQYLTLEGQTGGFLTPTAYVVYMEKGQTFSHPAVGFHFINASKVIGNIETFSVTEAFVGRAEVGYTRSVHQLGNSVTTPGSFSKLWDFNGMNVFHGKVVAINDGQFGPWTPGVAVGGVVRTNDKFVSGAAVPIAVESYDHLCLAGLLGPCTPLPIPAAKAYTNGDVYIAVTKTWAKKPVPFLANLGWKATNASIFGIGGQSTRFGGRLFGGLGIPLPITHGIVAVPSVGFTQEPPQVTNLSELLYTLTPNGPIPGAKAHLPTTLDYAVRVTQREHPHFAFDVGIGQVAGNIGTTLVPTGVANPPLAPAPVNLQARHIVGMGLSYRY